MFIEYERAKPKTIQGYNILRDGEIYIPAVMWNEMTERFEKHEIIQYVASVIGDHNIPFPYRNLSKEEVRTDWNRLKNLSHFTYVDGPWNAPKQVIDIDYKYQGRSIYFPGSLHGMKVSNQFAQPERVKCGSVHGDSPYEEWYSAPTKKHNFLRCLFTLFEDTAKNDGVDMRTLFDCLKLHTYLASQFKPAVAKCLYDFFKAKDVLDFSSGWGDRLAGFHASSATSYVGIDPNSKMHPHYESISRYCNTGKKVRLICSPAEDADLSDVQVDFVFTSPPYFNIEKYSQEGTQSWKRYNTSNLWLEGFLYPTLNNVWGALKEGGRLAVNIADKKETDICSPMLAHMANLGGTYEGVLGYKMMKRPDSEGKHDSNYIFCEPVFVWSKGKAPEPQWNPESFFFDTL